MSQDPLSRVEEVLAELVELDLALVRKVHAEAMAATEPQAIASLSRTYQRVARSVRQTAALLKSLVAARAALRAQAEKDRPPPVAGLLARNARRRALREAVWRVAWDEYERGDSPEHEYEARMHKAAEIIEAIAEQAGFERCDLDEQVQLLCETLDLDPATAARWRDLPEDLPPMGDEDDDEDHEPALDPSG